MNDDRLYLVDVWQPIGENKTHSLQVRAKSGYHAKIAAIKQLNLDRDAIDRFEIVLLMTELDDRLLHDDPLRERHTRVIARIHQLWNSTDDGFATLQWGARVDGHDGYHVVRIRGTLDEELLLVIPPLPGALEALEAALDVLAKAKGA